MLVLDLLAGLIAKLVVSLGEYIVKITLIVKSVVLVLVKLVVLVLVKTVKLVLPVKLVKLVKIVSIMKIVSSSKHKDNVDDKNIDVDNRVHDAPEAERFKLATPLGLQNNMTQSYADAVADVDADAEVWLDYIDSKDSKDNKVSLGNYAEAWQFESVAWRDMANANSYFNSKRKECIDLRTDPLFDFCLMNNCLQSEIWTTAHSAERSI